MVLIVFASVLVNASQKDKKMPSSHRVAAQKQAMLEFISKKKFLPEGMYTGVSNESDRLNYELLLNDMARRLMAFSDKKIQKQKLFDEFKSVYPNFENSDTEDREKALSYFEELMLIFGLKSSDGLLNKLLYGFDPQQTPEERNKEALTLMSDSEREFAKKLGGLTVDSAASELTNILGTPMVNQANIKAWAIGEKAEDMISLTEMNGKFVITWMAKGRFMFGRVL